MEVSDVETVQQRNITACTAGQVMRLTKVHLHCILRILIYEDDTRRTYTYVAKITVFIPLHIYNDHPKIGLKRASKAAAAVSAG